MKDVPFSSLSSPYVSPLGTIALSMRPGDWKHAETDNFIYHYFHGFVATPVSVEAEFYYHLIAKDLGKDTSHWERKAHIFIFEQLEDWRAFQARGNLEPWTGGIQHGNELFIQRDPSYKFKGPLLGHETAHLVVNRFFGANIPLWLNEGYAEYIARIAYAVYGRERGYPWRARSDALAPEAFVPLEALTNALAYPVETKDVLAFYTESERLVRFLVAADKPGFLRFFDAISKGSLFENALRAAYGARFPTTHSLEEEFKASVIHTS